jgi:hypothetical protein
MMAQWKAYSFISVYGFLSDASTSESENAGIVLLIYRLYLWWKWTIHDYDKAQGI